MSLEQIWTWKSNLSLLAVGGNNLNSWEGWSFHPLEILHHQKKVYILFWLVVSTHLKNISQNGNLPQIGVKIKNIWNHHLVFHYPYCWWFRNPASTSWGNGSWSHYLRGFIHPRWCRISSINSITLPETNSSPPLKGPSQKEMGKYSNHPFSGAKMVVSGRVSTFVFFRLRI